MSPACGSSVGEVLSIRAAGPFSRDPLGPNDHISCLSDPNAKSICGDFPLPGSGRRLVTVGAARRPGPCLRRLISSTVAVPRPASASMPAHHGRATDLIALARIGASSPPWRRCRWAGWDCSNALVQVTRLEVRTLEDALLAPRGAPRTAQFRALLAGEDVGALQGAQGPVDTCREYGSCRIALRGGRSRTSRSHSIRRPTAFWTSSAMICVLGPTEGHLVADLVEVAQRPAAFAVQATRTARWIFCAVVRRLLDLLRPRRGRAGGASPTGACRSRVFVGQEVRNPNSSENTMRHGRPMMAASRPRSRAE